jgi:hypothetical protein
MRFLFSANKRRLTFNRSTEDLDLPRKLPQALRPTERAYKRDAYPKRAMLSEGLRASVKFVVVLYFVIVMRTATLRRDYSGTTPPAIQCQILL